jgi:hypothetical protein
MASNQGAESSPFIRLSPAQVTEVVMEAIKPVERGFSDRGVVVNEALTYSCGMAAVAAVTKKLEELNRQDVGSAV